MENLRYFAPALPNNTSRCDQYGNFASEWLSDAKWRTFEGLTNRVTCSPD